MGYCGCIDIPSIETMRVEPTFIRNFTASGLRESHPHDVTITEDAPELSDIPLLAEVRAAGKVSRRKKLPCKE